MKIYLCTSCNKTVPLKELAEHRQQCGPNSEITLKKSTGSKVGGVFKTIFMVLLTIGLVGLGVWLGSSSFKSIASMRQLERIPATVVQGALPGEVNLSGSAIKLNATLKAPKSGTACFYYRYLKEKEEKDNDGKTHWKTVSDETKRIDFILQDKTGRITLRASNGSIDFSLKRSFSTQQGRYRYSEWRIDPSDDLFVFGFVVSERGEYQVRFDRAGDYDPIVSKYGEQHERLGMAYASIGKCWGGLVALAFAASLMFVVFRMHKLLVYFSILSTIIVLDLLVFGFQMMKIDLRAGVDRLERHEQSVRDIVKRELASHRVRWNGEWADLQVFSAYARDGLGKSAATRLQRIRLDLALATQRVRRQRNVFPERMLAPLWGIPKKVPLPLPEEDSAELSQLAAQFRKARVPMKVGWGVGGGALLIALITLGFGFKKVRFKRCIENLPTSPTGGAAHGLSEFKGIVKLPDMEEPLNGPLSLTPCVQYHYKVKEKRGSGKKARWVTVIDNKQERPFLCEDGDGSIWIDPAGAQIMTSHRTSRNEYRRRYSETRLEVDDPIYAIGECVIEPNQGDCLYMKKPQDSYPFILSNLTESVVMRKVASVGMFLLNVSFATVLLMALALFGLTGSFAATDYLASALAAPIFMVLVTLILHINDLVFLRERANRNWSNIDVSLQKRHDLLPNLQKIVQSYMEHESGVQQAITEMRTSYGGGRATDPKSVDEFLKSEHAALSQVLAVFEDYPELKADDQVGLFMRSMILLENEISLMRKGYNDAVETYNTRIQTLPDIIFAKMFHFKEKQFIHAESDVVKIPPSMQNMWQKDHAANARKQAERQQADAANDESKAPVQPEPGAAMASAVAATATGAMVEEDVSTEATDGRAVIFALLLSTDENVREKQLATIAEKDSDDVKGKTASLVDAVAGDVKDDVGRLRTAEEWFPKLEALSPAGYRVFREIVRELIEADSVISLFEYTLQKSMTCRLDAAFGLGQQRSIRHQDLSLIVKEASLVMSRLAHAEEKAQETGQAAFDLGVAQLNYAPKSDLVMLGMDECTLAAFDEALEELAHATNAVKANFLFACGEAVKMDDDYTYDQALLLMAMADTFCRPRPDWC